MCPQTLRASWRQRRQRSPPPPPCPSAAFRRCCRHIHRFTPTLPPQQQRCPGHWEAGGAAGEEEAATSGARTGGRLQTATPSPRADLPTRRGARAPRRRRPSPSNSPCEPACFSASPLGVAAGTAQCPCIARGRAGCSSPPPAAAAASRQSVASCAACPAPLPAWQVGPGAVRPQAVHGHAAVAAGPRPRAAPGPGAHESKAVAALLPPLPLSSRACLPACPPHQLSRQRTPDGMRIHPLRPPSHLRRPSPASS